MIATLIDKLDMFEVVRDKLADILKTESISQMALAVTAAKDPAPWDLHVFSERSNPWEEIEDGIPIANIWYESSNFIKASSNAHERQATEAVYNIDCVAMGSSKDSLDGHTPGDKDAAFNAHRAARLVRNILMSAEYFKLGMRGVVAERWPQSITAFQPPQGAQSAEQVVGVRIALRVTFNEFSPQHVPEVLEYISGAVYRAETGEILINADYDGS